MYVVDIANDLWYNELEQSSDTSIAAISFWLRSNIGALNSLIGSDYEIDEETLEIVGGDSTFGIEEVAILKQLYLIYWYKRKANSNLGAAAIDSLLEVSSDGATVKTVNRNNISSSYISLLKEAKSELKSLINGYKFHHFRPLDVVGDDTESYI
jgi:hypothetical protein